MKLPILHPSRCTSKLGDDLDKDYFVAEEKIDGSRYVLYIGADPYERQKSNALLSRRISVVDHKHVDRTLNVPHITLKLYEGLEGTVLDGEIVSKDFLSTNSIMNSLPAEALRKQKSIGPLDYFVFDVMFFRGIDVRTKPLTERRKILEKVIERMDNESVKAIPQVKGDLHAMFNKIVEKGGEGIIVKDNRMGYGVGWAKFKKSYDVSCVVSGFKPGKGKYSSGVGSIALSVYHAGDLIEIGFASGFDDKIRADMTKNPKKYLNRVVDVFVQEIQASKRSADNPVGRVRHPTFFRFRDDINAKDCTSEKLWEDIKAAKARNRRDKDE
jgi:ATP-dependent DNA ligase